MSRSEKFVPWLLLAFILVVAAYFRWTGLAWDSGYLFHPDERQILLVVSNLQLPTNLLELVSPSSPLNPKFFAYGSFPIYLLHPLTPFAPPTNIVGPWANDAIAHWVLLGRFLSGLFDLGTIVLTFALGKRIYSTLIGVIAAACLAVTVLHIQLSHFYTVDTILTFFSLATIYFAFRVAQDTIPGRKYILLTGICFGLALATKVTALPLLVPILYACGHATHAPSFKFSRARLVEVWRSADRPFLQIVGITVLVFILTQPYAVIDWFNFGSDVARETLVARGWLDYPYTRQYASTLPFVYQVTQGTVWGMGLGLGVLAWGGGVLFFLQWWKSREWRDTFVLSFALVYFIIVGLQYTKYLRYLLPLLPVLYIMAVCAWARVLARQRVVFALAVGLVLALSFLYSLAFSQMYAQEHPWLVASRWLYQNVPVGKTLFIEQWDDALPTLVRFQDGDRRASDYTQIQFPIFDADSNSKRAELANALAGADYIILASPRAFGSIGKLRERYPMTARYYEKLFNGELGYQVVYTTRRDPNLLGIEIRDEQYPRAPYRIFGIDGPAWRIWNWGSADESFSVYDHPQPIIFEKTEHLTASEIESRLQQ